MNFERPTSQIRVLLVEDNPIVHRTLARTLESLGCLVQVVSDGASGRSLLARMDSESIPDLILLDLGLPDMKGEILAREIRLNPLLRRCTLVAHTGQAVEDLGDSSLALFHGFLPKPATVEALRDLIHRLPIATHLGLT